MYQSGSPPGSGEDRKVAKSEKFSPLQFANAKLARINFYTLGGRSLPGRQCQLLHFFAVSNIIHFTCSVQHNALYTVLTVTNYPCGKLVGGRPSGATRGTKGPPRATEESIFFADFSFCRHCHCQNHKQKAGLACE